MSKLEDLLQLKIKPREKIDKLVKAVVSGGIPMQEFMAFFESSKKTDKGLCADVMEFVSLAKPALLAPHLKTIMAYVNFPLPKVKWGTARAIGNMAKEYPGEASAAIGAILKNTEDSEENTTVVKWCAAFALGEIAKYHVESRRQLLPAFDRIIKQEKNNGVKNVYVKAMKVIAKGK